MKRRDYVVLMVVVIVAMVLMPFAPCIAGWTYLGYYVKPDPDPPYDSGGDGYGGWSYSYNANTSAGANGVSASGSFSTSAWVSFYLWEGGLEEKTKSEGMSSGTVGKSYYAWIGEGASTPLTIHWSVDVSGKVKCRGFVEDRYCDGSTYVSSSATAGAYTDYSGHGGSAVAHGSASTTNEDGSADVEVFYYAEEEGSPYADEYPGEYRCELYYSIDAGDEYNTSAGLSQFTAYASIGTNSSAYGSGWLTVGDAIVHTMSWDGDAPQLAYCSGSASVTVGW